MLFTLSKILPRFSLSFLFFLGFLSFFFTSLFSFNPADPSWQSDAYPNSRTTSNLCGPVGAYISSAALYYFGRLALLVPVFVWYVSHFSSSPLKILRGLSFAIAAAAITETYMGNFVFGKVAFAAAGALGQAATILGQSFFGEVGLTILSSVLLLLPLATSLASLKLKKKDRPKPDQQFQGSH